MTRTQLEHILRASAAITGADRFGVIGSQAILGEHPNAPPALLVSYEADVFSFRSQADADLIDGSIGEESPFHKTFGYYAHGVSPDVAILSDGWRDRLVPIHTPATGGATGLCLETHDIAVSKLVAGREKDLDYVAELIRHKLADPAVIASRLATTPLDAAHRTRIAESLKSLTP